MLNQATVEDKELEELGYQPRLHRSLTTWQLASFGLNYLQPIGPAVIFGFLLTTSQGSVALPYFFAFVSMIFTILSYSVLIREYPLAGSVYNYVKFIIGPFWGFIAGWLLALDYILIPTITSISAATYAHQLVPAISYESWLITFVLSMGLLNLIGIRSSSLIGSLLLLIQIAIVLAGFGICIFYITNGTKNFGALFSLEPFHFESIKGVLQASSLAIFSFLGFDAVTTLAEESVNPRKDIPRAMLICAFIGFIIMFLTGYLGVLMIPSWKNLASDPSWVNATLFHLAKVTGGEVFALTYTVGFIIAMVVTNLVGTTAVTRLLYGMGRDSKTIISKCIFNIVNQRWNTPHGCIFFIVIIELVLGSYANQDQLAELINFGAISGFIILNFSVIFLGINVLKKRIKLKSLMLNKNHNLNFLKSFFAFPTIALIIMLVIFLHMKPVTLLFGMLWMGVGVLYYWYSRRTATT